MGGPANVHHSQTIVIRFNIIITCPTHFPKSVLWCLNIIIRDRTEKLSPRPISRNLTKSPEPRWESYSPISYVDVRTSVNWFGEKLRAEIFFSTSTRPVRNVTIYFQIFLRHNGVIIRTFFVPSFYLPVNNCNKLYISNYQCLRINICWMEIFFTLRSH